MMSCMAAANGPSHSSSNTSTHSTTGTSTTQACAACKFQRRKCHPECPLAPYFPPDQPKQFLNVHKLYGVSNTLRILKQVDPSKRHDAMKSILYEADARDRDPVHGCYGIISYLQSQAEMLRDELEYVRTQVRLQAAQQQMLAAAQGAYSSSHHLSSSINHSFPTTNQAHYQYPHQHHEQFTDDNGHGNRLTNDSKHYHQLTDDTKHFNQLISDIKHYHNNGIEADFNVSPSCAWQQQLTMNNTSSPTSATATTPTWFHQYLATSPHCLMHTPHVGAVDSAYVTTPQLAMPCSSVGPLPALKPSTSFDVKPSFDTRSLVDYETGTQHSFDHESVPKPEHPDESSAESSIKDPKSNLEQEDLESATALFTLTSTSHSS